MRDIKFRAWTFNGMIGPFTLSDLQDGDPCGNNSDIATYPICEVELMQYTGLKDRNGVEIYEGDIISLAGSITGARGLEPGFFFDKNDTVAIAWDDSIAAWSIAGELDLTDHVEVTYRNHAIQLIHQNACKVIGNIHESPELLEEME